MPKGKKTCKKESVEGEKKGEMKIKKCPRCGMRYKEGARHMCPDLL